MDPGIGRTLFNLAFLILVLSLIPLPFLDSKSAEFVVDIMALIISITLLSFVSWDVRRQVKMTELKESDKNNNPKFCSVNYKILEAIKQL